MKKLSFSLVLAALAVLFVSCSSQHVAQVKQAPSVDEDQTIALLGSGKQTPIVAKNGIGLIDEDQIAVPKGMFEKTAGLELTDQPIETTAVKTTKKARSFAEMKEMVKTGAINMSKQDQKTLNKLDKLYKGDFNKFRSDAFEMTPTAKIIAGVGAASALIAIFVGSWFFAFLFLLAVFAFLFRWFGMIDF